jgi:hypothetical protein
MTSAPSNFVFISHCHLDRDEALRIQHLLETNNVKTFLDQDEILAGDALPERIQGGIERCNKFLLIWSINASKSKWVEREWKTAFGLMKRIIPVVLDPMPLPGALQNFVYVDRADQEHGNAELFRAVLGYLPNVPVGVDMFPGAWEAEFTLPDGSGAMLYKLELKSNGQITGTIEIQRKGLQGLAVDMAKFQLGVDFSYIFQPTPVKGSWSYKPGMLNLDLVQYAYGQEFPFRVQIQTTGKQQDLLYGTGPGGASVTFRRNKQCNLLTGGKL